MLGVWVLWFEFWGLGGLGGMQPINVPAAIIEFLSGVWQPNAAQHLAAAAQSNMQCVYLPHPRVPLHWFAHRLHSAIAGVCLNTSFCSIASVSIHKPARPSRLRRVSRPTILHPSIHPSILRFLCGCGTASPTPSRSLLNHVNTSTESGSFFGFDSNSPSVFCCRKDVCTDFQFSGWKYMVS